jgi:hypothetical protein
MCRCTHCCCVGCSSSTRVLLQVSCERQCHFQRGHCCHCSINTRLPCPPILCVQATQHPCTSCHDCTCCCCCVRHAVDLWLHAALCSAGRHAHAASLHRGGLCAAAAASKDNTVSCRGTISANNTASLSRSVLVLAAEQTVPVVVVLPAIVLSQPEGSRQHLRADRSHGEPSWSLLDCAVCRRCKSLQLTITEATLCSIACTA